MGYSPEDVIKWRTHQNEKVVKTLCDKFNDFLIQKIENHHSKIQYEMIYTCFPNTVIINAGKTVSVTDKIRQIVKEEFEQAGWDVTLRKNKHDPHRHDWIFRLPKNTNPNFYG